ncbi:amidase [Furfurilactobacillus siliginis]|uniref:Amidase n=1 Tax=Furfurilactobacillus siliginis TaxID=348151 RepID=A0A0R2L4A0_9LACO|nr:amidase [Furfurilactobacillus siliginis]KRN96434.1 hypothetical protein IV55_GL001404 [Furfurilactobacillus siliginis]GEK29648.1 amidase [Furfurilactobacillus siliginis]
MVDALELARQVRTGETTSEALVQASLAKIATSDQTLNAVVHLREEKALAEARKLTDTGQPFLGVPLLLKNMGQDLKGEPVTLSSRLFKDEVAGTTDNFVSALQAAGFIIIGQTNAPEFGFKNITDPVLYGKTRNAWNQDYYSGGSSGGAATSVAAGYVPLAAGNDGGGSIRIPASFSGLIGLKPTRGRVPVGPNGWRGWGGASINFALTRSIRDTATLLDWLQTYQPAAPFATPVNLLGFNDQLWDQDKHLRIAYSTVSPVGTPVSKDAKQAVLDAVDFLSHEGFAVTEQTNPLDGVALMKSYYVMNGAETVAMFDDVSRSLGRSVGPDDMERLAWLIYQAGLGVTGGQYSAAISLWDQASAQMDAFHDQYDLYLTPTTAHPAPRLDNPLVDPAIDAQIDHVADMSLAERMQLLWDYFEQELTQSPFTQQANLTGQPALSLPTYVTKTGLPLGIQFTARKGDELTLLRMGRLFEQAGKLQLRDN